jgi:hypothetical protein
MIFFYKKIEPITVKFDIQNPLQIPLQLTNVHLTCMYGPKPYSPNMIFESYPEESIQSSSLNLLLQPGETRSVC